MIDKDIVSAFGQTARELEDLIPLLLAGVVVRQDIGLAQLLVGDIQSQGHQHNGNGG